MQRMEQLKVGPSGVLTPRGRPSKGDVSVAMNFAGHMLIELIQPNKQCTLGIPRSECGFHH